MEKRVILETLLISLAGVATALIVAFIFLHGGITISFQKDSNNQPSGNGSEYQTTTHTQAVVSSQELATEAGTRVLNSGGTAADAAVAVAAALSVAEPWFSSALGGGTWALYYDAKTGTVTSLDGVGPVGSRASVADYEPKAGQSGLHQTVVPGAWDGWMLWLDEYGVLELDDVLAPAIGIARDGYPVGSQMAFWLNRDRNVIMDNPSARDIYAPDGALIGEGDIVHQHDLADTFEDLIAAYDSRRSESREAAIQAARDYFYRGPLAEEIVEMSDDLGGYLTLEDFHTFAGAIVDSISIDYSDEVTVFQSPPNSQGITMLLALNILKDYDFSGLTPDDPDAVHMQAEALKLAFADRYYHVGDPERTDVPVAELLSDEHADRQRPRIDMNQAFRWPIADSFGNEQSHTTTFHTVDRYGNAAAVTTSLGAQFMVVGDTGIHLNNRMRMLSLEAGNPNELTPGYKVRHTSNPYLALRDGTPYIVGGNTGVDTQPQGQMQQFLNVYEFGLSAQASIDRPRFVSTAFPASAFPHEARNTLQMEGGFPSATIEELRSRGHTVETNTGIFGAAHMIVIGEDETDVDVGVESRSETASGRVIPSPAGQ